MLDKFEKKNLLKIKRFIILLKFLLESSNYRDYVSFL